LSRRDVVIQPVELVDINVLRVDGDNPNRMSKRQLDALRKAIVRFGFIVPIVTNRELLIADGEQRLQVARDLGMSRVPVVRLDVEDVDRRLLRQVLNKLKGQHVPELDLEEFVRIVELGGEEDLKRFLVADEKQLSEALGEEAASIEVESRFEVVVECDDEPHQKMIYERLTGEGLRCRVLTL
jgi:ParB-like chromosome segregation protein Spo0J